MDNQQMLDKAKEVMSPFETEHIVAYIQHLTLKSAMENPWFIGIFSIFAFYAIIKRSKPVLVFLFASFSVMLLIRFTLQGTQGNELTLSSTLPFAFGALVIGAALIYFIFIKSE